MTKIPIPNDQNSKPKVLVIGNLVIGIYLVLGAWNLGFISGSLRVKI